MKAKIGSLEQSAESLDSRQQLLSKELENAKRLQQDAEDKLKNQSEQVKLWIKSLINIIECLAGQVVVMGMDGPAFSVNKLEVPSARLGVFYSKRIKKLKVHMEGRAKHFATESQKLAHDALFTVLCYIACRHLDINLGDGFKKPLAVH